MHLLLTNGVNYHRVVLISDDSIRIHLKYIERYLPQVSFAIMLKEYREKNTYFHNMMMANLPIRVQQQPNTTYATCVPSHTILSRLFQCLPAFAALQQRTVYHRHQHRVCIICDAARSKYSFMKTLSFRIALVLFNFFLFSSTFFCV